MKKFLFPGLVALFIVCSASKCKNSNNDFLARLYNNAYTESQPLKPEKDALYKPLLGYWNLSDDRPLEIRQKDDKTYEFRFMTPYLDGEDVIYEAQINKIGGKNYVSMKGYRDAYMFFKVKMIGQDSVRMLMINSVVPLNDKPLSLFLANHAGAPDTSLYFTPVPMGRLTQEGATNMQMALMRKHVYDIDQYERFASRFPNAEGLAELKHTCLEHSLEKAYSVSGLYDLGVHYPEVAIKARAKAKRSCETTKWCVEYLKTYPDEPAKDSIKSVAYAHAKNKDDYKLLIQEFPDDKRTGGVIFNLALLEYHEHGDNGDQSDLMKDYADYPSVIQAINSIRAFRNFQLGESAFVPDSYLLSSSGKSDLDKVVELIHTSNSQNVVITDLYFALYNDYDYGGDNNSANFFQSANKCKSVQDYLNTKGIAAVIIHVIPIGEPGSGEYMGKENGMFSIDPDKANEWRKTFYTRSNSIKQNPIIPNGNNELTLDHFIRIPAIEDHILKEFASQIALYKKKQAYRPVIPPNYYNTAYEDSQPGFAEFNARLLAVAKENKLKRKRIPLFVIP